jgi:DNA invertase Pin-like site-specific DNA recombinase
MKGDNTMKIAAEQAPHTPTAVAYLRTASTQHDAGASTSLERQCDQCFAQARKLGIETPPVLYIDAGQSGMNPSRPALDTLFDDLAEGQTRYVITADRARLARNPALALSLERRITHTGAELIIVTKTKK